MGDGIKYVFEVEGKGPGLDELDAKLEAAEKTLPKVEHASKAAGEGHKKHGREAEHLGSILERVTHSALHPFLETAERIAEFEFVREGVEKLLEVPGEMIEKLKELGEEMVDVAAKTERTNTSFELFFGRKEGAELVENLEQIAGATEFTDQRLKDAAISLAKVGFAGQSLNRALAASLDVAALSPDKDAGMSSALATLEMVKATGRIRSETLLSLGLGPDAFFKELSARTGEGLATLKKKLAEGKVDTNEALESLYTLLTRKTGKDLGGAGVDMSKTLEAKLTHLKDLPEQFFQKLAKTEAFDKLTGAADRLLEKLSPEGKTGMKLFEALEHGASAVVDAIDSIDIDEVGSALEELASDVKPVIDVFTALGRAVGHVASAVDAVVHSKFAEIVGIAARGTGTVLKVAAKGIDQSQFGGAVGGLVEYLTSPVKADAEKAGKATGDGLAAGTKASESKVEAASHSLGDAASSGTREALGIHSPSKVFAELGAQTAAGFAAGVEKGSGMVDDVVRGAFAVPAPMGGRVAAGGSPIVVSVGDIVVQVHGGSSSTAEEIGEVVRAVVRDQLTDVFEDLRTEQGV